MLRLRSGKCPWSLRATSVILAAVLAPAALAQGASEAHDPRHFSCTENGLAESKAFGCQLIARTAIARPARGPLFWHVTEFPTSEAAEAAKAPSDVVASAEGRVWLLSFGPERGTPRRGKHRASVGPLPLGPAESYTVESYYVVMPAGTHTRVHTHPGPEAWYILAGEQCLEMPGRVLKARVGETRASMVAPPDTPMRLSNSGRTARRALFIVVHDSAQPWSAPSDWKPSGACEW